eukprot:5613907-Karenia_brevis.AAC.1
MRLEIKKAVGLGLIPPMTENGRSPPVKNPEPEEARKEKNGVRNKNAQIRLHKLKICARLVAWLDSFIDE